ncbi:hypothetical protein J6590_098191 [Homalodisca vitripennis]|nr:hypothetical protein J6590_098191 [Homalodisca vitripennis]
MPIKEQYKLVENLWPTLEFQVPGCEKTKESYIEERFAVVDEYGDKDIKQWCTAHQLRSTQR